MYKQKKYQRVAEMLLRVILSRLISIGLRIDILLTTHGHVLIII